jgi:hypothetical protein
MMSVQVEDVMPKPMIEQLATALSRTLAALETPGDLTEDERQHVIADGAEVLEQYEQSVGMMRDY